MPARREMLEGSAAPPPAAAPASLGLARAAAEPTREAYLSVELGIASAARARMTLDASGR